MDESNDANMLFKIVMRVQEGLGSIPSYAGHLMQVIQLPSYELTQLRLEIHSPWLVEYTRITQ